MLLNYINLGLIYNLECEKQSENNYFIKIKMTLTAPGCGMGPAIASDAEIKVKGLLE